MRLMLLGGPTKHPCCSAFGVRAGTYSGRCSSSKAAVPCCSVFVTAGTQEHEELIGELLEALDDLGVDARRDGDAVSVDGVRSVPLLVARAHPTPAELHSLVGEARGRGPAVVVADRISDAGRDVLRAEGWGWLDRRGHLRLWAPGVRVEAPLRTIAGERPTSGNLWTTVGLEVALHTLVHPGDEVTARRVAPEIGRSVGATHELVARFTAAGLIGQAHPTAAAAGPLLGDRGELARRRLDPAAGVDPRRRGQGRRSRPGARRRAGGDTRRRPGRRRRSAPRTLLRALGLGAATAARSGRPRRAPTRCWVRRSPVDWIPLHDEHPPDDEHPWSVAAPMLCAVRLAADPARGREIVEDWGIVPGEGAVL